MAESGHFFFEGVEKTLEIDFVPDVASSPRGLRELTRTQVDELCTAARCTIIANMSNDYLDSYVLSESSLFVYPFKMILKTCGTTTLLMCLEPLLKATAALGMKVEWVAYTRKDFQRPGQQKFPHRDHNEESLYLKSFFPEGNTFILGPITSDHWVVFVADYVDRATHTCVDRTLDMMMFGIDEEVARLFVKDAARFPRDSLVTTAAGIDTLLPGSQVQEFAFDPCGYSANGLLYDAYWTIHVTPEASFSYASFETNIRMPGLAGLIRAVLAIFRPRRWSMTLFADNAALAGLRASPFQQLLTVPLVHSTAKAIAGPCVITHDSHGNTFVDYAAAAAAAASAAAAVVPPTPGSAAVAEAASPQQARSLAPPLPSAAGSTGAASAAASPGDSAASAPAAALPSAEDFAAALQQSGAVVVPSPPIIGGADAVAPTIASGSSSSGARAVPAAAPAAIAIAPVSRATSGGAGGAVGGRGLSYVMTTKSQTEFVGEYSAVFGIYTLVQSSLRPRGGLADAAGAASPAPSPMVALGGAAGSPLSVAEAAQASLPSVPRVKYVVARRIEELKNRTESM